MMSLDAVISITGMLVCLIGLIRVVVAYRGTTRSAEPDPERVKRFVESAPPIPAHLIDDSGGRSPKVRRVHAQEAEPGEDQKDHEVPH